MSFWMPRIRIARVQQCCKTCSIATCVASSAVLQNQPTVTQNLRCTAVLQHLRSSHSCCFTCCVAKPAICISKPVSRSIGEGCAELSSLENLCASPVMQNLFPGSSWHPPHPMFPPHPRNCTITLIHFKVIPMQETSPKTHPMRPDPPRCFPDASRCLQTSPFFLGAYA